MRASGADLTAKQEKTLAALISSPTLAEAAKVASVAESTLFRWLNEDGFREAYRAARREAVEHATTRLQADCGVAVRVLREIAEDERAPASARVAAARIILEGAIRGVELMDLQNRLERLEAALEARTKQDRRKWA